LIQFLAAQHSKARHMLRPFRLSVCHNYESHPNDSRYRNIFARDGRCIFLFLEAKFRNDTMSHNAVCNRVIMKLTSFRFRVAAFQCPSLEFNHI